MELKKIAVIFPGIGYHKDKPLLYYSAKLAAEQGYEVISVSYHDMPQKIRGNTELMQTAAELAIMQSRERMQSLSIRPDTDLLLIGKSIGTIAAAQLATEYEAHIRQIWYTPLEETFKADSKFPCIAFFGENDPWSETDIIRQAAGRRNIPLHTYADCNHSLECGDVMRNLLILQDVMQKAAEFLHEK